MPNSNVLIFIIILPQMENQNELTWGCLHIKCKTKLFTSVLLLLDIQNKSILFFYSIQLRLN